MENSDKQKANQYNLLFAVRRSVRYHTKRQQFFERLELFSNVVVLILGSLVAFLARYEIDLLVPLLALFIALITAINVAVGYSRRARIYNALARRFIELEKKIVRTGVLTESDYKAFTTERLTIEADEPPINRSLDLKCHNELCYAENYDEKYHEKLSCIQRILAYF
ncbi:MAG: hypothetical protein F4X93_00290 [Proteobacteria bacterium]|nr:hypothetical protein [Pseudomonadota bacterium]